MKPKHRAFVTAYLGDAQKNGTKAAILAGYSQKTAGQIASQLLKREDIQAAIENRLEKADRFVQEQAYRAVVNIAEMGNNPLMPPTVRLTANQDIADRAGIGEVVQAKVRQSQKQDKQDSRIQVVIGFLDNRQPTVHVADITAAPDMGANMASLPPVSSRE